LAALGVLRFFASAHLLSNVRVVSSVSGGSVTNGLFTLKYPDIAAEGYSLEAFDRFITAPLVSYVTLKSLTRKLVMNSWKAIGPLTRTDLLARALDQWFFDEQELHKLTTDFDFVINATNLNSSVRYGFQQHRVGDYTIGFTKPKPELRLAEAVAASAAVPGVFAPVVLKGHEYPCDPGYPPRLVDGGVYDNLGIEPLNTNNLRSVCSVVLNAGGVFRVGKFNGIPIVRNLSRSSSVMYRQTTTLRMRELVDDYKAWEAPRKKSSDSPPPGARYGVILHWVQLSIHYLKIGLKVGPKTPTLPIFGTSRHRFLDSSSQTQFDSLIVGGGSPAPAWPLTIQNCSPHYLACPRCLNAFDFRLAG